MCCQLRSYFLIYKKIIVQLYVVKNFEYFIDVTNITENRAFDVKIKYYRKLFVGQKYVDYLSPKYFNSMPLYIKKQIWVWLFSLLD